jgi:hypothetical protein
MIALGGTLAAGDQPEYVTFGLRTRKLRAGLSALGIAIGVAAIVAVLAWLPGPPGPSAAAG